MTVNGKDNVFYVILLWLMVFHLETLFLYKVCKIKQNTFVKFLPRCNGGDTKIHDFSTQQTIFSHVWVPLQRVSRLPLFSRRCA